MTKVEYRPQLTQWCLNGCVFFYNCLCAERELEAQKKVDGKLKSSEKNRPK
jgi:hypothetical protein